MIIDTEGYRRRREETLRAMALDAVAARRAIRMRVAEPLGLAETRAAEGIVRVATVHMAAAIRLSLFEKGLDPQDFTLVSFGGAGGLHAAEVAAELGARAVVFPRDAGTLSAWGMLFCDIVHDCARATFVRADARALPRLRELAAALAEEGRARLERDEVAATERGYELSGDMRYAGQAYGIVVPFDAIEPSEEGLARAVACFHELHEQRFAHSDEGQTPELVTLRLVATGRLGKPARREHDGVAGARAKSTRRTWLGGQWCEIDVHQRARLAADARLDGPALIEEEYATILLPAGWRLRSTPSGDLLARCEEGAPCAPL